jgi:hypothetical protein
MSDQDESEDDNGFETEPEWRTKERPLRESRTPREPDTDGFETEPET